MLQTSPGAETGDGNGLTRQYAGGKMLASRQDGIGIATFNQPEKHNAMSVEMWLGLADILEEFERDDSTDVAFRARAIQFLARHESAAAAESRQNGDVLLPTDGVTDRSCHRVRLHIRRP